MTVNVLYAGDPKSEERYAPHLREALKAEGLDAYLSKDHAPETVDYIAYSPSGPVQDFTPFTRLKAVLSFWAGVEKITGNPSLTVPLARMADQGLQEGMVEWVTGHTLRYHLDIDEHVAAQDGTWRTGTFSKLARDRQVTILGLGNLGAACAQALAALNFNVTGWSRRPKDIDGITCLHGDEGLKQALKQGEIAVLLLPDTPATTNLLNAERLSWMPRGARLLNPGRGPLIDDEALLAALDSGQIAHATLDVFRIEPLPADHPYWSHENVTVTPHIASETRAKTAGAFIARNISRMEAGLPLLAEVDRQAGY